MSILIPEFIRNLRISGLLTAAEIDAIESQVPAGNDSTPARSFARRLVQKGKLTNYQAWRLLESDPHGLVLGNVVITDKIGAGGMGDVYKAYHTRMKRPAVVKMLKSGQDLSPAARQRFEREIEAAAQLTHPNIVTAFDANEVDGNFYMVMEFIDGANLAKMLSQRGPLPVADVVDYMMQAACGLHYAHELNIVHRDVKPGNLLVDSDGVVKVFDLGLVRFAEAEADQLTKNNEIVGTVDYMAPEQAGGGKVDCRTDIYSLGCTMYRLLTGALPFANSSPMKVLLAHRSDPPPSIQKIRPDVPQMLEEVFRKMVAKAPDDRYDNMQAVYDALQNIAAEMAGNNELDGLAVDYSALNMADTQPLPFDELDEISLRDAEPPAILHTLVPLPVEEGQQHLAVGIDLGTTNSAIAYIDQSGNPLTVSNAEGEKTTPSAVLFDEDEVVVGIEALKAVGVDAMQVAEGVKRELGYQFFTKSLGGREYPPESLEAWVLNKLRTDATRALGEFSKVVITVPAYFDEVRRKSTQDAGYMAGFEVLDIINEPTAAALAFGFRQGYLDPTNEGAPSENILVYDLGGGTFDVTVMQLSGNRFSTLATDGDWLLGGRDWDQKLVDYVAEQFLTTHGLDPRNDAGSNGRLWRQCEAAKQTLSARSKSAIFCDCQGSTLRVPITREQFQQMTQPLLERTRFTTEATVRAASLDWSSVDRVLLIGGSTRMPAVQQMLEDLTGRKPDTTLSPDEAVAHGAALYASLLLSQQQGKPPQFAVRNVNSHSLGVVATDPQTSERKNAVLIPRNTPLPVAATQFFTTRRSNQKSILVQIIEGESESPDDCYPVGKCVLRNLPANLPAQTLIEVRFRYESNGRLTVTVKIDGVEDIFEQEITREASLNRDQLDSWRQYISGRPPLPVT